MYSFFGTNFHIKFLLIYKSKVLENSSKWCVKISLANELVVFCRKQIKFLLDEKQNN